MGRVFWDALLRRRPTRAVSICREGLGRPTVPVGGVIRQELKRAHPSRRWWAAPRVQAVG
jgi:hypothetical protein